MCRSSSAIQTWPGPTSLLEEWSVTPMFCCFFVLSATPQAGGNGQGIWIDNYKSFLKNTVKESALQKFTWTLEYFVILEGMQGIVHRNHKIHTTPFMSLLFSIYLVSSLEFSNYLSSLVHFIPIQSTTKIFFHTLENPHEGFTSECKVRLYSNLN